MIKIDLDIRNNNQHVTENEKHYTWVQPTLIISGMVMIWLIRQDKEEEGENWFKYILKYGIYTNILSHVFKYIGFLIYLSSGNISNFF